MKGGKMISSQMKCGFGLGGRLEQRLKRMY